MKLKGDRLGRNLEEWLAYQAQAHFQPIDMGLERLSKVLTRLQWNQPKIPVITVAGTNGKGSVVAYSAAILAAAGYRVGVFTSPHLCDYRERIRLHDRLASGDELVWAFEKIEAARTCDSLTFFEYNTLAALLLFEASKLDAWVLEVGMGGRLDAVNVVDPTVAVVVSIGFDHQEFLGTSLEAIGREKAGIFRAGRPAVLGSANLPESIETVALSLGAMLKRPDVEFAFSRQRDTWQYRGTRWSLPNLNPPALLGDTQYHNAATAVAAVEELLDLEIPVQAIQQGLRSAQLVGRFQMIKPDVASPTWILDVAHNPDAAKVLAHNLMEYQCTGKSYAICGILSDKDAPGIVGELHACVDAWWFCSTIGARSCTAAELRERVAGLLLTPVSVSHSVAAACAAVLEVAAPQDRILVFGSFHTVGPALDWLDAKGVFTRTVVPEYNGLENLR